MTSRKATLYGLICLIFLHSQSSAHAQYVSDDVITGQASGTLYSAVVPLAFPRSFIFARGDVGDRPGVMDSYASFGGFMPMQFHGPDEVFFLEGEVWVTEQNSESILGGTFGIGNRWLIRDYSQLIGINAFAAWDQTGNGNNYDGAGVGVEWLSDYLGITANAYIPWNNDRINATGPVTLDKDSTYFTGSNLAFTAFQPVEEQVLGGDIEIGSAIPRAEWLSVYVGGYYFDADQDNEFSGVSGRIQMDMTNAIVNLTVSDDDRFGTTVNFVGELRLGDGPLNFAPRSRNLDRQMFDRVRRRSRILTTTYIKETSELAINPATGLPFEFIHVDNTAGPGGDGSFGSRFDELNDASNMPQGDIILVYRGDTTYGGTHLDANGGLFLEDGQIVLGEGYEGFTLEFAQFPGMYCPIPFGSPGTNPFIDGDANSNLINLASNNQILGLNLLPSSGGAAIVGSDMVIDSTMASPFIDEINRDIDLTMDSTGAGAGIVLTNVSGNAVILNSGFNIDNTTAPGGIVINNTDTDDLAIIIANDQTEFPDLAYNGGEAGISLTGNNSNIAAMIDGIVSNNSQTGLSQNTTGTGDVDIMVTNSDFENAVGDNFAASINGTGGTSTAIFTNSSLAGAGDDAIDIFADNQADFMLMLDNTSGDGANDDGIVALIENGSTVTISSVDSTFSDTVNGDGLDVTASGGSTFGANFTNGAFDNAGNNAIALNFDGMDTIGTLVLENTSGTNAAVDAINIQATDQAAVGVNLSNSTDFASAGQDGLDITNNNATVVVQASSTSNTPVDFSNFETGNGLISNSTGSGASTSLTFTDGASFDNVAMNTALDAINITSDDGAITTLTGSAISGANAGDDGINLNSNNGTIVATITAAGSFANAGQNSATGDGIEVMNQNGGMISLNLDGAGDSIVDFTNAAQNGMLSISQGTDTLTVFNFNDGADFSNAGMDAIGVMSTAGAGTDINGTNMVGTNVGLNAIELIADGTDSIIDLDFTGSNDFSDAAFNGLVAMNTDGGGIDVNIGDADFSSTMPGTTLTGDGLVSYADGTGTITNFTFNSGASFNNASDDAIDIMSDNGAVTTLTGVGISGSDAMDDGIVLDSMAGTINIAMTETGSFANAGSDGLDFTGADSAVLNINIAGTAMTPADFSGAGVNGVNGNLDDSSAMLTLTNTNFDGAMTGSGMIVNANNESIFMGSITDSTFNMAALDGIAVNIDGSMGQLDLTNVDANMAGDNALMVRAVDTMAVGTSTLDVNLNNVNLNDALGGDAINAIAMDGAYIDIDGVDVNGMNAADMGVQLSADASRIDFNLSASDPMTPNDFTNSGDSGLVFIGMNGATVNVNVSDTNFDDTVPGGFGINGSLTDSTGTLVLTDVTANNAEFAGLRLRADNSVLMGMLDGVTVNDAGTDAVFVQGLNGADIDLGMTGISGLRAGDDGFDIVATGVDAMTMTDINIQIDNSTFMDSTNNGLEVDFRDFANVTFNATDALNLSNAGQSAMVAGMGDAINLYGDNNATANIHITNGDLSNAFDDMTDAVLIMGGATGTVVIDPTTATGAGDNGVEFNVQSGGTFNFTAGTMGGPSPDSPISTAMDPVGNNGVLGTIDFGTVNMTFHNSDINTDGTSAGDGFNVTGTNAANFTLNLNNSNVDGWSNGNGIVLDFTDSNAMLNLNGASITGAGADAISITAATGASANQTGSMIMVDLGDGADLSDAMSNAISVVAGGMNTQVGVQGTNTTGDNAGDDAIYIATDNGALAMLQLTEGGSFQNAGMNGAGSAVNLEATNGSGITAELSGTISADMILDGAASFGVNGSATGGSSLQLIMDQFSTSGNTMGGINLSASGMGSSINNSMITNGVIQNNGVPMADGSFGIQLSIDDNATVGNRAGQTAGITFEDLMIGNSDPMALSQDTGIIMNVDNDAYLGAIFDGIFNNFNEANGFEATVNGDMSAMDSALLVFTYSNGTISNNGGDGMVLNALNSGDNPNPMMQTAGIIAGLTNVDIMLNSNEFVQPVDPMLVPNPMADGDDIGFGIKALADNNVITVNLDNVNLGDNEEGATQATAINGGVINFNFANMTIFDPVDVCALGAGSFASVTLDNVTIQDISGNNAAISMVATGGGQAVGNFTDVTILNVEAQAFAFLSDGDDGMGTASNVTANFTNLMIDNVGHGMGVMDAKTGLALDAVLQGVVSNGAEADINLIGVSITDSDLMSVTNVNALDMDAMTGGQLNLVIDDFTIVGGVTTAQAGEGEIDVTATGANSLATIDFNDITIDDSDGRGFNLESSGGGAFDIVQLNMLSATGAQEEGFNLTGALNDADGIVTLENSNFDNAGLGGTNIGVNIDLDIASDTTLNINSVTANNATGEGVLVRLDAGPAVMNADVNVDNVVANDTGATGSRGALDIKVFGLASGANSDVTVSGNSSFNNAANDGIQIQFNGAVDSTATVSISDTTATGALGTAGGVVGDGIFISGVGTDITDVTISNVDVSGAASNGLEMTLVNQDNPANVTITDFTANDTGSLAMDLGLTNIDGDSTVSLTNVTADNTMMTTGGGIDINFNNVANTGGAGTQTINLDNVSAQNAAGGVSGLNINVDLGADADDTIDINLTQTNGASNFSGATGDGISIATNGVAGTMADIAIDGVTANAATLGGVNIDFTGGITGNVSQLDNVTATGAQGGAGLSVVADAMSTLAGVTGTTNNFDGASGNGIEITSNNLTPGAPTVISLNDTSANNAGIGGVDIDIMGAADGSSVTLSNVDATGAMGADGLNINADLIAGATMDVTVNGGSDFSNSAMNGAVIDVTGDNSNTINLSIDGLTVNNVFPNPNGPGGDGLQIAATNGETINFLDFANITANGNSFDGIDILLDMASVATFDNAGTFENVTAQNNQRNGMKIEVTNGSTFGTMMDPFSIAGLDLSNNAMGGAQFDALDIKVHEAGSSAFVDFSGITINNTLAMGYTGGGRGVDADVYNGASLNMNLSGVVNNTGLEGVDINVGQFDEFNQPMVNSTGSFTGTLSDLTISNSGQNLVFTGDNLNIFVTGDGTAGSSTADITLDNVDALNSADADGIDIDVLAGADATVNVQNGTSGSNNTAGVGFDLLADGANTTLSLLMDDMQAINNFDMNGMQGVLINLTNGVTVNELEVFASASGNGGNGIEINANDGTGVTINTLDIGGAQANNNTGSGLVVNFNAVNNINSFALTDAAFTGNMGDQVYLGFQNMALTDLTIDNVDVTGNAASEDGLHIDLLDTTVTTLMVNDLVAMNNGQNGLNLELDESALDGATTTSIGTGVITASQFIGNAAQFNRADATVANDDYAGVLISLTDDATADFDIYENPNGFLNNQGIGLNIQVMEQAVFALDNTNSQVVGASSFYANDFIGNGGFGFLLEADEAIPLPPDGMGPQYNLVLGDIGFDPNTFSGNADAAVAVIGSADSTGSFNIVNSVLTDTVNGAGGGDPRFNGDGLAIRLEDSAILTDLTIDGTSAGVSFNNNAGSGLNVSISQNSMLGTNSRMTVINTTIMGNQRHGIEIARLDDALFGPNATMDQILIGTAGNGNTIVGTATSQDGINIFNGNMGGAPQPLDVRITENNISNVRDGIFVQQVGNAQLIGAMTDNVIDGAREDGINIRLDQDAALGDPTSVAGYPNPPTLTTTPAGAPFLFAGNQILNSGQHGYFFDTNSSAELGAFSGGAFVNTLITGGTVNARSLIEGSTGDGIRIQDNSDNLGSAAAAQNTYTVTQTDITQNNDGIRAIVGGAGTVINANAGIALNVGDTAAMNRFDVLIEENRDDGIDLTLNDSDGAVTNFNMAQSTIRNNGSAGDGEDSRIAGRGHGVEVDLTNQGRMAAVIQNVDVLENAGDGFDFGVETDNIGGTASNTTVVNFTISGSNVLRNGERGFDARLYYDPFAGTLGANNSQQDGYNSVWNIGVFGGPQNVFSQNGDEGLVFDLQAQGIDTDVVSVNGTTGVQGDINQDVFVDVNRPRVTPNLTLTSTQHPIVGFGSSSGAPVQESRRRIVAQVDVINNTIQNNGQDLAGTVGGTRIDGLVMAIGSNTLLRSTIAANTFGGNNGDDIRIYAQRSGTFNAPDSLNNNPAAQIGGMNQNRFVHDPVAYLDLVFGSIVDNAGNVIASPGNTGDQITVLTAGTGATSNITNGGLFTNSDPIKGGTRSVILAGLIQVNGVFNNTAINNFNQNSVQQPIAPQFQFFVPHGPGSPYPALTFPATSFP